MYIMAAVVGCGVVAGIIYLKRMSIAKAFLTTYSDYRENQIKQETQIFNETPKDKLISCRFYEFNPDTLQYERTTDKSVTSSKICKLKFKNMVFYSFLKNYNLRDTYLEYIDSLEDSDETGEAGEGSTGVAESKPLITHLNKITNRTFQLLSATATVKIKSHNVDYIPEFDILDLINEFSFNGNTLFLTDANKVFMIALMNTTLNKRIELSNFCIDGNKKNLDGDNLDIQVHYQLITNNADIYNGVDLVLKFSEYNDLTVVTEFKDL